MRPIVSTNPLDANSLPRAMARAHRRTALLGSPAIPEDLLELATRDWRASPTRPAVLDAARLLGGSGHVGGLATRELALEVLAAFLDELDWNHLSRALGGSTAARTRGHGQARGAVQGLAVQAAGPVMGALVLTPVKPPESLLDLSNEPDAAMPIDARILAVAGRFMEARGIHLHGLTHAQHVDNALACASSLLEHADLADPVRTAMSKPPARARCRALYPEDYLLGQSQPQEDPGPDLVNPVPVPGWVAESSRRFRAALEGGMMVLPTQQQSYDEEAAKPMDPRVRAGALVLLGAHGLDLDGQTPGQRVQCACYQASQALWAADQMDNLRSRAMLHEQRDAWRTFAAHDEDWAMADIAAAHDSKVHP